MIVLDDDPTGPQLLERSRVLLRWSPADVRAAASTGARSVHLLTNSRALDATGAYEVTLQAATAAHEACPNAQLLIRGDSTLRGHVAEEYRALRDAAHGGQDVPLLLAMALPSAGRITRDGVHLHVRGDGAVPLHATEYARDPALGYTSARMLEWADERSGGLIPAGRGCELPLAELRRDGPRAVQRALEDLTSAAPAACVPDCETLEDLQLVAEGLRLFRASGGAAAVRCAPAFVGAAAGNLAGAMQPVPAAGAGGVLLICGSYVPTTSRQLAHLAAGRPHVAVEADLHAFASDHDSRGEQDRLAGLVSAALRRDRFAALVTPRTLDAGIHGQHGRERVAHGLAGVVALLDRPPGVLIAKGGITSAVTLSTGLGAFEADVLGPVLPGISLWHPASTASEAPPYLVVPGNVGDDGLLSRLVASALDDQGRKDTHA